MTSPAMPAPSQVLRDSIVAVDAQHPLPATWLHDYTLAGARLDRLDAKTEYFVGYIEYLEQRIAALEARSAGAGA
ncbi:hypothetical protein ACFXP7_11185 [Microbacterium sp. P06]|uniref:hypothetical protein n=1 Tax=Microbacterium sp. P06 TaxID=3366949 RepID=UPI003745BC19